MSNKYKDLLLKYVNSQDHFEKRGYFGNVDGAPKCGCVEDMPMMTGKADCTEATKAPSDLAKGFQADEVQACQGPPANDLGGQVRRFNEQGDIFKFSLLEKCPKSDEDIAKMKPNLSEKQWKDLTARRFPQQVVVPDLKLDQCNRRAAVCCFTKRNEMSGGGEYEQVNNDNADVCFRETVNYHCVGFAWSKDASDPNSINKQQLLQHVVTDAHGKKMFGNIFDAPQCGCAGETFPTITDAACVQHDGSKIGTCKDSDGKDLSLRGRILSSKEDDQKELLEMALVNVCPMNKDFKNTPAPGNSNPALGGPTSTPLAPAPSTNPSLPPAPPVPSPAPTSAPNASSPDYEEGFIKVWNRFGLFIKKMADQNL